MTLKPLLIFGASQVAEVFSGYLRRAGIPVDAHLVDASYFKAGWVSHVPVMSAEDGMGFFKPPAHFVVGMSFKGLNSTRAAKYQEMLDRGFDPITFVHNMVGRSSARVGRGAFIMDLNILQDAVEIGENCVLWSGNHVGHHTKIGNHVWLSSGIVVSGGCEVGDYTFIGSGATIADGVKIGKRCIIGAGSLVLQDVPDDCVVAAETTPISKVSSARAARLLG